MAGAGCFTVNWLISELGTDGRPRMRGAIVAILTGRRFAKIATGRGVPDDYVSELIIDAATINKTLAVVGSFRHNAGGISGNPAVDRTEIGDAHVMHIWLWQWCCMDGRSKKSYR